MGTTVLVMCTEKFLVLCNWLHFCVIPSVVDKCFWWITDNMSCHIISYSPFLQICNHCLAFYIISYIYRTSILINVSAFFYILYFALWVWLAHNKHQYRYNILEWRNLYMSTIIILTAEIYIRVYTCLICYCLCFNYYMYMYTNRILTAIEPNILFSFQLVKTYKMCF